MDFASWDDDTTPILKKHMFQSPPTSASISMGHDFHSSSVRGSWDSPHGLWIPERIINQPSFISFVSFYPLNVSTWLPYVKISINSFFHNQPGNNGFEQQLGDSSWKAGAKSLRKTAQSWWRFSKDMQILNVIKIPQASKTCRSADGMLNCDYTP